MRCCAQLFLLLLVSGVAANIGYDLDRLNMTMRWYIVHAYSNFEKKVLESIREQATQRGLSDKFEEILFPGADKKPMPIPDVEAERIKGQVADGVERPKAAIRFEIGENVRVADGPFASFNGVVEEVDESRSRVKVAVSIFGRATPVDLEFGQVEKQ